MSASYQTELDIEAPPERVFEYFTKPELLVRWMGERARLEASSGGLFAVDINGVIIRGHFVRVEPPRLLEVAWGEAGNDDMPPGSTRLLLRFERRGNGTRVLLEHSGLSTNERGKHAQGWPHFLARLVVAACGGDPGPDPWAHRTQDGGEAPPR